MPRDDEQTPLRVLRWLSSGIVKGIGDGTPSRMSCAKISQPFRGDVVASASFANCFEETRFDELLEIPAGDEGAHVRVLPIARISDAVAKRGFDE